MSGQPAAGGGHWVEVEPERLAGWLQRFAERHGAADAEIDPAGTLVTLRAGDGALAECHVPFPPLAPDAPSEQAPPEQPLPEQTLLAHALHPRRIGVLLVRRGGFAAGVFDGVRLETAKVGQRHVQGRTAAGGWSQQRFARRREGQTRVALQAAADAAALVLGPAASTLDAVVLGGDRQAAEGVLDDPRLAALRPLVSPVRLQVPDPRRGVLEQTPRQFRAVRIRVVDPTKSIS